MGTLYPNTFESEKFCSVNDSLTNPIFSACFLVLLDPSTLLKILSRLKRLTSCGYLHFVVTLIPAYKTLARILGF